MTQQITTTASEQIGFEYGGENQRVMKSFDDQTVTSSTLYLHGQNDYPLMEKTKAGAAPESRVIYIYSPTGLLAMQKEGEVYYVLKDHLGSTRVLVDENGTVAAYFDYAPFGNLMRSGVNTDIAYRFTGQEFDSESGLHNFRARLYDSDLGRFYATDPGGQFASPFLYAGNNPVVYIDEDGRIAWFVPILIGAAFNTMMNAPHIHDVGDFFAFAGIGALGGALSMVGNPGAWYGLQNVLVGALEGGLTGGLNSLARGDKFGSGFKSGAIIGGAFGLVTSEQFGNFARGQGWRSNDQVLNKILIEGGFEPDAYQEALEYFGFEGEFVEYSDKYRVYAERPDLLGLTDPETAEIFYNYPAFSSYDQLAATHLHELKHARDVLKGIQYSEAHAPEFEYSAFWKQYKNYGLYRNQNYDNIINSLQLYGGVIVTPNYSRYSFQMKWYHFIYKIPRRYGVF